MACHVLFSNVGRGCKEKISNSGIQAQAKSLLALLSGVIRAFVLSLTSAPPRPPPVPPRQAIVTALYSCSPDQPDELAFQEGDKIVIVKKHSEDWWVSEGAIQYNIYYFMYVDNLCLYSTNRKGMWSPYPQSMEYFHLIMCQNTDTIQGLCRIVCLVNEI